MQAGPMTQLARISTRAQVITMLAALVMGVLLLAQTQSAYADERDFELVNQTGTTITYLYVSASNRRSWEEDLLGSDVLPNGRTARIHFSPTDRDAGTCMYDIRGVGANGQQWTAYGINLCTTSRVTLR